MTKKEIYIDGHHFSDLEGFYNEIDRAFSKDLGWRTGHNLDAFNDVLRGGFGVYEYGEPVRVIWRNFLASETILGKEIMNIILEIIAGHDHIEFIRE